VLLCLLGGASPASGAQVVLPDLRMAKLTTIRLDTTTMPGHRLLRYTATMVNIGPGALEVRGSRASTSDRIAVVQRVYNDDGTFSDVSKPITMQYAGDGHDHWHSLNMEGGRSSGWTTPRWARWRSTVSASSTTSPSSSHCRERRRRPSTTPVTAAPWGTLTR
jgi:hypothetical protein